MKEDYTIIIKDLGLGILFRTIKECIFDKLLSGGG